jgi:hypothetical protein
MRPFSLLYSLCIAVGLLCATSYVHAQEFRFASHGTIGAGPSSRGALFDVSAGLSLTGCINPDNPFRLGPYGAVGTNGNRHSYLSSGLMGLWKSSRSTSFAVLTSAGAITPLHRDADWTTGEAIRTALVLWFEDESATFSVASPTVGVGVEFRSIPGNGVARDNEVIFQLDIDPFAAVIYTPILVGSAIYGMPH